jgi:hypothetical protein
MISRGRPVGRPKGRPLRPAEPGHKSLCEVVSGQAAQSRQTSIPLRSVASWLR